MVRKSSLSFSALVILCAASACSSSDNAVGSVVRDSGFPGGSTGSGGAVSVGGTGGTGAGGAVGAGGQVAADGGGKSEIGGQVAADDDGGAVGTGGKGGAGSGGAAGSGGQLPVDGGVDAPADTGPGPDLPEDRPSIDGDGTPAVCVPAGANGQLATQAAGALVVAPDEKHVAFLRDPHMIEAGCISRGLQRELGTLVVLELQPDGSTCQRVVADNVSRYTIFFSSDSQYLVFMEGIDSCGVGKLKAAHADGSNVRLVQESASNDLVGIGSTVFFTVKDQDLQLAAPFAGGKTISLGMRSDFDGARYASNATGTAVVYKKHASDQSVTEGSLVLVALPSGTSQILSDGAAEQSGNRIWSPGGNWVAFCHGTTATLQSLAVVAADGSRRIDVSANSPSYAFSFSPNDAWFVYPENDSSGGTRVLTYSLKDGKSTLLGVLPKGAFSLAFSDDSASVVATLSMTSSTKKPIYAGTSGVANSLRLVYDAPGSDDIAAAGGYVAISDGNWATSPTGNWTVGVYPISGGTGVTIPGGSPLFEPGVPQPHLMVRQSTGIAIASTAGTGVTAHEIPAADYFSFTTWLGSAAVYGTTGSSMGPVTISALTNAGAVATLLANQAGDYAWSPVAVPTRIFYSRKEASDGGPAGVFYADLPR